MSSLKRKLGASLILVGCVSIITWHFYCAASFERSTSSIPWPLNNAEIQSAHAYFYWPPAMRGYVSGLARERRETVQRKANWGDGDADRFLAFRRAELQALIGPWAIGSGAEKASREANVYLWALRDTASEVDKRKRQ